MSYALGGIGLPHLDVGGAVRLFQALAERVPQARSDLRQLADRPGGFRYDVVRARGGVCSATPGDAVVMTDLDGKDFQHGAPTLDGSKYCTRLNPESELDTEAWRKLRHWCRVGLRRHDMQEWVILDWPNNTWVEA